MEGRLTVLRLGAEMTMVYGGSFDRVEVRSRILTSSMLATCWLFEGR